MRVFKRRRKISGKTIESNTWYGEYRIDGMYNSRRLNLGCIDKQVAIAKLQKIVVEAEKEACGLLPSSSARTTAKTPLCELLSEYIRHLTKLNRTARHIKNNRSRITVLQRDCGWKYLQDITPESFENWRERHMEIFSPKTLNDYFAVTLSFLNWLVKQERLIRNPLRKIEPLPNQQVAPRRSFTDEELNRLVTTCPFKRRVVYLLAAYTGLRKAELKALQWGDLRQQDDAAWLAVRASTTKNKKSANQPLRPEILRELLQMRPAEVSPTDAMLSYCLPKNATFKKDLAEAGINSFNQDGKRLVFHSFRHTYATNLSKSGVAPRVAMEMMRHSDIKLTMKTYTDASQLPVKEALGKLPWLGDEPANHVTGKVTAFAVKNGQNLAKSGGNELTYNGDYSCDSSSVCQEKSQAVSKNPNNQNVEPWGFEPHTPTMPLWCSTN